MPKCSKCYSILPPQFFDEMPNGDKLCKFCIDNIKQIEYGNNKIATKEEIIKEYEIFLKMILEKNEIIKNAVKGDFTNIPEKLL